MKVKRLIPIVEKNVDYMALEILIYHKYNLGCALHIYISDLQDYLRCMILILSQYPDALSSRLPQLLWWTLCGQQY